MLDLGRTNVRPRQNKCWTQGSQNVGSLSEKKLAETFRLQCNLEKTAVIPISGNYDINDKLCLELALSWENRLKDLNDNNEKCFKKVMKSAGDGKGTDSHLKAVLQLLRPSFYPIIDRELKVLPLLPKPVLPTVNIAQGELCPS